MRAAIIGGTGTLGNALARRLAVDFEKVSIFSRCELKQKEMRARLLEDAITGVDFTIGDVRDPDSLIRFLTRGKFDVVYHVAALKHVDVVENNPEESVSTNILGTIYVADACEVAGVPLCVFSSTDKAVDPINAYGMSKGICERILLRRNQTQDTTRYAVYRWGNVIGSRGSVVPSFVSAIRKSEPLRVTDLGMTRFWIRVEDAVDFVMKTQSVASRIEATLPKMGAATVAQLINTIAEMLGRPVPPIEIIGNRGQEKQHEFIISQHDSKPRSSGGIEVRMTNAELAALIERSGVLNTLATH